MRYLKTFVRLTLKWFVLVSFVALIVLSLKRISESYLAGGLTDPLYFLVLLSATFGLIAWMFMRLRD
jgi:hypothetical protein